MPFKFLLNNTEVDDPINWDQFTETLERDDNLGSYFIQYPRSLTFDGNGYTLLRNLYDSNNQCDIVELEVRQSCGSSSFEKVFDAKIYLSAIRWTLSPFCMADCQIFDDTYSGKFRQNFNTPLGTRSPRSKNGTVITQPAAFFITPFNPLTGADTAARRGLDLFVAMEHLVKVMTDDEVDFESNWYSSLPTDQKIALSTGYDLRVGGLGGNYTISFQELYSEIRKKYPLIIYTDSSGLRPKIKMELEDVLEGSASFNVENPESIDETLDNRRLYGSVRVGSNEQVNIQERGSTFSLPYIEMISFVEEEYTFDYLCNSNSVLDLVNNFVIDHNVIQDIVVNNNNDHDERFIFLQYDSTTNKCTQTFYVVPNSPPYFYNEIFLNSEVINRFDFPATVVKYIGTEDDFFEAEEQSTTARSTAIPVAGSPVVGFDSAMPFTTETSDPNGNYNPGTGVYTAPVSGGYGFKVSFRLSNLFYNVPAIPTEENVLVRLNINSGSRFISSTQMQLTDTSSSDAYQTFIEGQPVLFYNIVVNNGKTDLTLTAIFENVSITAADTVQAQLTFSGYRSGTPPPLTFNFTTGNDDTFECTNISSVGGVWSVKNPNDFLKIVLTTEDSISKPNWDTLKSDITNRFNIINREETLTSIPRRVSRNMNSGRTTIEVYKKL